MGKIIKYYVYYVIYENDMQLELKPKGSCQLNRLLDTLLAYPPNILNLFYGHPQSVSGKFRYIKIKVNDEII